eukprot:23400-Rhodomonas_salina.1
MGIRGAADPLFVTTPPGYLSTGNQSCRCDDGFSRTFDYHCVSLSKPLFSHPDSIDGVHRGFVFVEISASSSGHAALYLNVTQFGPTISDARDEQIPVCSAKDDGIAQDDELTSGKVEIMLKDSSKLLAVTCFRGAASQSSGATFEIQTAPSLLATFYFTGIDSNNSSRLMHGALKAAVASGLDVNFKRIEVQSGIAARARALGADSFSQRVLARSQIEAESLYDIADANLQAHVNKSVAQDSKLNGSTTRLVRMELSILDSERTYPLPVPTSAQLPLTTSPAPPPPTTMPSPEAWPPIWPVVVIVICAFIAVVFCTWASRWVYLRMKNSDTQPQPQPAPIPDPPAPISAPQAVPNELHVEIAVLKELIAQLRNQIFNLPSPSFIPPTSNPQAGKNALEMMVKEIVDGIVNEAVIASERKEEMLGDDDDDPSLNSEELARSRTCTSEEDGLTDSVSSESVSSYSSRPHTPEDDYTARWRNVEEEVTHLHRELDKEVFRLCTEIEKQVIHLEEEMVDTAKEMSETLLRLMFEKSVVAKAREDALNIALDLTNQKSAAHEAEEERLYAAMAWVQEERKLEEEKLELVEFREATTKMALAEAVGKISALQAESTNQKKMVVEAAVKATVQNMVDLVAKQAVASLSTGDASSQSSEWKKLEEKLDCLQERWSKSLQDEISSVREAVGQTNETVRDIQDMLQKSHEREEDREQGA